MVVEYAAQCFFFICPSAEKICFNAVLAVPGWKNLKNVIVPGVKIPWMPVNIR